ncbi:Tigger transposable element-derived protein 6, partial [Cucumispora dikerogammari]
MTAVEFNRWLEDLNQTFKNSKRKTLMFLDNFSGHKPNYTYSNIEICFLPKNSSAKLQPLDAGIIRSFKSKYFNYQMSNIVSKITPGINAETLYKQFSLKDALVYISY